MSAESRAVATGDLAELLGVRESTVRRWCISGEVQAVKVGRKWFVAGHEYARILDALTVAA